MVAPPGITDEQRKTLDSTIKAMVGSTQWAEVLKARGIKDRIQHRRHKHQRQLPYWQSVRNKLIGRVRSAVERTFSVLKGRYRLHRLRYLGLHANALHFDLVAIAYNLNRAAARQP